ncbi:hypothetical protein P9112_002271 [Eukaryota sp. TZLM1-RC]
MALKLSQYSVLATLLYNGHAQTASSFVKESGLCVSFPCDRIAARKNIVSLIKSKDIPTAISLIHELDPILLQTREELAFKLYSQMLIDQFQDSPDNWMEITDKFTSNLAELGCSPEKFIDRLGELGLLLVIDDPQLRGEFNVDRLLDPKCRFLVANDVNEALMMQEGWLNKESLSLFPTLGRLVQLKSVLESRM